MSEYQNPVLPSSLLAPTLAGKSSQSESKIIYKSEVMGRVLRLVDRVAPSQATVLILGESGTGKELVARAIHERSPRRFKPFVAINCGALRETLLESELFGHEKGSFTGAYTRKIGLAEVATGGTLFLDEIGELSPGIQAKLLRFLQEGEIYRVGGKDPIRVDIRLVSATNKDLETEVQKGHFREDLFYRVNTITAHLPSLRQRKDDIPMLVSHFLATGRGPIQKTSVSEEAMTYLMKYDWPGNIRELQNICERIQILAEGHTIMPGDLPENIRNPDHKINAEDYDPTMTIHELEKRYILKALAHFKGNKTQAANALGITIKTLYNKLHEYGEFENYAIHTKVKGE